MTSELSKSDCRLSNIAYLFCFKTIDFSSEIFLGQNFLTKLINFGVMKIYNLTVRIDFELLIQNLILLKINVYFEHWLCHKQSFTLNL
jgi:hypothetical protein